MASIGLSTSDIFALMRMKVLLESMNNDELLAAGKTMKETQDELVDPNNEEAVCRSFVPIGLWMQEVERRGLVSSPRPANQ